MTKKKTDNEKVVVLRGLDGVRLRTDMYAGIDPVTHMIKEVVDNSMDQYFKGNCDLITGEINTRKNYMKITDNGAGMPNDWNDQENMYNIEVLTTQLHAGSKFDDNDGETRSGRNGIGIKIVTAISEWGKTTSERNGIRRYIEYSKGKKLGDVVEEKAKGKSGTITEFIPDKQLLKDKAPINVDKVKETFKLRSYLNKGLRLELKVDKEKFVYYSENGISEYLTDMISKSLYNMKPINMEKDIDGNRYEVSILYDNSTTENIMGFANGVILDRGTHETAFKRAITTVFNNYIKNNNMLNKKDSNLSITGDDVRKGMHCIINMRVKRVEYSSQTKNELGNKEVASHISEVISEGMNDWIEQNDALMKKLCNRIIQFARASESVKKAQEKIIKVNNNNLGMSVSNKFTDCFEKDPKKRELFICEGDSAGGSIVMARSKKNNFQAVYRLKGKILNTIGKETTTIMANKELSELIAIIFGTNDIKHINYDDVKFSKICILTDADDDGKIV